MRVNRYVLDANVWVSYIITQTELKFTEAVVKNNLTILICDELLEELERVFKYPHLKQYDINIPVALNFIKNISVTRKLIYPIKRYIPDDVNDDYIVALALQTDAGYITSGDKHILSEKGRLETRFKKLKILTKSEFERKIMK
jgi:putative PIN family toxin of toxin-antitoxin system